MECNYTDATGCNNSLQREQSCQSCLEPTKYVQKQQFYLTLVGKEQPKSRTICEQSEVSLTNPWRISLSNFLHMLLFQEALCEWAVLRLLVTRFIMLKWILNIKSWFFPPSYLISSPLQSRENLLLGSVGFLPWNLRHQSFLDTFGFVSCKNLLKLPLPNFGLCLCRNSSCFIPWIKSWPLWISENSHHVTLHWALLWCAEILGNILFLTLFRRQPIPLWFYK